MANPYLPLCEYIPDGEPRVFNDRVYIYGSHDRAGSDSFCDYRLKVWSAPLDNLNKWVCHGDIFVTVDSPDRPSDTDYTHNPLYAPDVVEKDGKYYLYCYIFDSKGCVAVSDKPEGSFKFLSCYDYDPQDGGDDGILNDPGVLVNDDGRVYVYYGFERSNMNELDPNDMHTVLKGSLHWDVIPQDEPFEFFEASSIRKINGTYYLIYSPRKGSRLAYATSSSPTGPFEYRGYIVDNSEDYPRGNNHGSLCCINGQWYIFYHRMTNGTITSRRDCVERVEILPDGTIPKVEMTSLGFEESLCPYYPTAAQIACVLKGGCYITEKNPFSGIITAIKSGCIIGYKYFDFGDDFTGGKMKLSMLVSGCGASSDVHIMIDGEDGEEIGVCRVGEDDGIYTTDVKCVTGRHSLYFRADEACAGWFADMFKGRQLFELKEFVFIK
ncbi:MAG: family 43 glycosylhydrolase [Oscillospiraceae bacterium]|nr:family 43 glycosylhydrolase [Oscillospiraceae bacterium]